MGKRVERTSICRHTAALRGPSKSGKEDGTTCAICKRATITSISYCPTSSSSPQTTKTTPKRAAPTKLDTIKRPAALLGGSAGVEKGATIDDPPGSLAGPSTFVPFAPTIGAPTPGRSTTPVSSPGTTIEASGQGCSDDSGRDSSIASSRAGPSSPSQSYPPSGRGTGMMTGLPGMEVSSSSSSSSRF